MSVSADILEGCRKGKSEFQEKLYRILTPKLFPVCLRYASCRNEAEDWMQDAWIKIFSKLADFRNEGSFEGWTRRVTVTTCLENLRKKSILFEQTELARLPHTSEDNHVLASLSAAELTQVIQNLPPGYRAVFNLFVMEEFSHEEIAVRLGISVGTSKSQLARARQLLKDKVTVLHAEAKPHINQQ